jgi:uncharacterized protein YjbJ (UPF0337 family)
MSNDIMRGQWKQMKGKIKEWWGDLTDDDIQRIDGNHDVLVGALQQKYGYAKERALSEVQRRIDEYAKSTQSSTQQK